uniref:endonuclease n=1 Tax=Lutibacter sp. TaxID=1925666 RepID=UPI0035651F11
DEFKGDIARMYFYFATRYENVITTWGVSYDMFNGTTDQVFAEPFLTVLMTWHTNDPVSTHEIDRNNAIYARQGNRNPFIDHPEYVAQIWSTTPDTQAPTAPTNLIASNITNTTVDLNWTISTDNIGVTSYQIFKDGVFLASSAINSYNVTGLTQNTTYDFTVFAKDAFGNTSTVSNMETITTTNIIDVDAPSIPLNLIVSNETSSTIDLSWSASTDNVGVTGYDIYVDGVYKASSVSTTYTITGLSVTTTYSFTVLAKDGATNESIQSIAVDGTTTAIPSFCGYETFTNIGTNSSSYTTYNWAGDNGVSWTSTDSRNDQLISGSRTILVRNGSLTSSAVSGGISELTITTLLPFADSPGNLNISINGSIVGTIPYSTTIQTSTIAGLNISGDIIISVSNSNSNRIALDNLSWSCYSGTADTEVPTAIVDLIASGTTSTGANLSWTASTDNVGVASYEIFKDGLFLTSSAINSYTVTGLTASTSYNFTVYAKDAAGNTSLVSNTAAVTTTAANAGGTELFISEYVEGSSNNKAIEIANFTGSSVNLANYSLRKQANGAGVWVNDFPLVGTLANGSVHLVANSASVAAVTSIANQTTLAPIDFNGNDPIGLFKNDVLIDLLGVFNSATVYAENVTLRRKSTINSPNTTYTISEWDSSYPTDTFDGLGAHTLSTLSTPDFVQNLFSVYPNPSITNQVTISVQNNTEIEAIQFYNLMGQLVINIQKPTLIYNRVKINNIPKGMYIVKITNKNAYSAKRLIVQ